MRLFFSNPSMMTGHVLNMRSWNEASVVKPVPDRLNISVAMYDTNGNAIAIPAAHRQARLIVIVEKKQCATTTMASETGAVLIFDEVMTSRQAGGGMQELLGITPDLMTLGKYTGGGMTFGAFGGSAELMSMYDPRRPGAVPHAGTFNNNVLSMAAGYAGLTEIFPPSASRELFARGEKLRAELNEISPGMRWTGLGSMMTVHFQREPVTSPRDMRSAPAVRELFHLDMLHRGFHLARRGMIALSLEIGNAECDVFRAAVTGFHDDYSGLLPE